MKKVLFSLLSLSLIMCSLNFVKADNTPEVLSVTANQIDNRVHEEFTKVVVKCKNTQFTKTGAQVQIMGTNRVNISNFKIIDDTTIEFGITLLFVDEGAYPVEVRYREPDTGRMVSIFGQGLNVRQGHIEFEKEYMLPSDIEKNGITIKMYNNEIEDIPVIRIDGKVVKATKVMNRIFRAYPDKEVYAGKSSVEVKVEANNTYYTRTLYLDERMIIIEPNIISSVQPRSFYINSTVYEFPENIEDIQVVITGNGRHIKVENIIRYNPYRILAYTPFYLAYGTYNMTVTWPGLDKAYTNKFVVIPSSDKSDMDLAESIRKFLKINDTSVELTIHDEQALRYSESSSKEINLSHIMFDNFKLSIPYDTLNILYLAGNDLNITFADLKVTIKNSDLRINNNMDLYLLLNKADKDTLIPSKFLKLSKGIYYDSNLGKIGIRLNLINNAFDYTNIKTLYINNYNGTSELPSAFVNGAAQFVITQTGTYYSVIEGNQFSDITKGYWGEKYIYALSALDIINGVGNNMFSPESNITRAQYAKMICLAIGLEPVNALSGFADVFPANWHNAYVCALEKAGIISGSYFRPDEQILRKDMAEIAINAYKYYTKNDLEGFTLFKPIIFSDIYTLSEEEQDYIYAAVKLGIINGMGNNSYAPNNRSTRAQASAVIYRLLEAIGLF